MKERQPSGEWSCHGGAGCEGIEHADGDDDRVIWQEQSLIVPTKVVERGRSNCERQGGTWEGGFNDLGCSVKRSKLKDSKRH